MSNQPRLTVSEHCREAAVEIAVQRGLDCVLVLAVGSEDGHSEPDKPGFGYHGTPFALRELLERSIWGMGLVIENDTLQWVETSEPDGKDVDEEEEDD